MEKLVCYLLWTADQLKNSSAEMLNLRTQKFNFIRSTIKRTKPLITFTTNVELRLRQFYALQFYSRLIIVEAPACLENHSLQNFDKSSIIAFQNVFLAVITCLILSEMYFNIYSVAFHLYVFSQLIIVPGRTNRTLSRVLYAPVVCVDTV